MKYLSCKLTGIDKIISKLQYIKSSMTGATSGAETAYPPEEHEFSSIVSGDHVIQSLVFCVVFGRSLIGLFLYFA